MTLRRTLGSILPTRLKTRIRRALLDRPVVDLRGVTDDPLHADYRHPQQDILIDVPVHACRGLRHAALRCTPDAGNPMLDTVTGHATGLCCRYEGSPLQRFHQHWQPQTAAESLGLADVEAGTALAGMSALEAVSPWWPDLGGGLPANAADHIRRRTAEENRENGVDLDASHGVVFFGPVSVRKGQLEYERLIRIWESIRDRGYHRSDDTHGDITGTLLMRGEGEYAVLIGAGQHRMAALAATGAARIPVRLVRSASSRVIRREDAGSWPHVRSGLFDRTQALAVFDRCLEGRRLQERA